MVRKVIFGICVTLILGGLVFVYQAVAFPKESGFAESQSFTVERGENMFRVAKHLEEEGLIRSRIGFDIYVLAKGMHRNLKAGVYTLAPSMGVAEITGKIVAGETSFVTIQIPEGWTAEDIAEYLQERGIVEQKDFLREAGFDKAGSMATLENEFDILQGKPVGQNLEGYLFPDTYHIVEGMDAFRSPIPI